MDRILEIDKELAIQRVLAPRVPDEYQKDHDEFIEEMSLGGRRYEEK
jgi:hypothetical protein